MSVFPTRILLATDGSEDSALATRAAVDLNRKTGAELHVVHAWHTVPSPHFESWINSALEQEARELLEEQTKKVEECGGEVTEAHLKRDTSHEAITTLADEIGADLIVMGSRGMGPLKRILLGSVSEGVVHHAHVAVLLMRGGEEVWPPSRLVVGEDSSENARRAGKLAVRFAELFGADTLLVHVVSSQRMILKAGSQGAAAVDEAARQAQELLEQTAEEIKDSSVREPQTRVVVGYPALTLTEAAEEEKTTLLVVGSRGLNSIKRTVLGSVSSNVLRTAAGPVLVVPPPARQDHA